MNESREQFRIQPVDPAHSTGTIGRASPSSERSSHWCRICFGCWRTRRWRWKNSRYKYSSCGQEHLTKKLASNSRSRSPRAIYASIA